MDDALTYVITLRGGKEAAADVKVLEHEVDKLGGTVRRANDEAGKSPDKWGKFTTALGKASSAIGPLVLAGVALGPALVPALAAATAGVGALGAAFGPAAVGAGLFGKLFTTQVTEVGKAATQIEALQRKINATYGPAFATQHAAAIRQMTVLNRGLTDQFGAGGPQIVAQYGNVASQFDSFRQSFNPQIFSLLSVFLDTISKLMPIIRPLLSATADAFIKVAKSIDQSIGGPGFRDFMKWMTSQAGSGIMAMAKIIENLAVGFVDLLRAFSPMASGMRTGLVGITTEFRNWASNLGTNSGFQKFLAYVREEGPRVGETLGKIAGAIGALIPVLAAAGPSSLIILNAIADTIKWLTQWPVINQFVGAAIPFVFIVLKLAGGLEALTKAAKTFWAVMTGAEAAPFLLTPMGLLLTALVIAAVVIITHWDQIGRGLKVWWAWIKTAATDTANWVTTAWGNMVSFIDSIPGKLAKAGKGMWDWITNGLKGALNAVIGLINNTLVWGINQLITGMYKADVLGILPGGLHVSKIPALADGGRVIAAGHALVGERGPEVLSLPAGAQVTPLQPGSLGRGDIIIPVNIDGRELMRVISRQTIMASAAGA